MRIVHCDFRWLELCILWLGAADSVASIGTQLVVMLPVFYPLDRNFGIPGPFGHGNRLPTCKYLAMQPQLCRGGLGAL